MMRRVSGWILPIAVWAVVLGFVLYPVWTIFQESLLRFEEQKTLGFTFENFAAAFTDRQNLVAIWNSVWVSVVGTLLAAAVGVPLAFLFHRVHFRGRFLLGALAYAPLTLPPVVGMFSFWMLTSDVGLIPRAFGALFGDGTPMGSLEHIPAVLLVHAYSFSVFFYAMVSAALYRLDPAPAEAARTLGASPIRVFFFVTLPALWPALAGAATLSFMVSMGSFSAPYFLANGTPFLSVAIYEAWLGAGTGTDYGLAAANSVIGVVICMSFLFLTRRYDRPAAAGRGSRLPQLRHTGQSGRWIRMVLGSLAVAILLLPQITILLISFSDYPKWISGPLPSEYTLANFINVFSDKDAFAPIWTSIKYSSIALCWTLLLGMAAAWLLTRRRMRSRALLDITLMLPFALPGTVIAFCLVRAFSVPTPQTFMQPLVGTVVLLPVAYFVRCIPLAVRPLTAALSSADPSHEEAARTLGAGAFRVFRCVLLPHMWPAVLAAGLLIFVTCLGEFVASIMTATHDNMPIGVYLFNSVRKSNPGGLAHPAAYSVLLLVLMAGVIVVQGVLMVSPGRQKKQRV